MIRVSKLKRSNGYWYVRYWLSGQAIDESARTKSESAAETYHHERSLLYKVHEGRYKSHTSLPALRVGPTTLRIGQEALFY